MDLPERGGDGTGTGGDDGFCGLRGDCSNRIAVCSIFKMCRIEARTAALWWGEDWCSLVLEAMM